MSVAAAAQASAAKPRLVFFYSNESGRCRRVEGFLAQVLQQRKNHDTFQLYRVDREQRPDLAERFHVDRVPTLYVVEGNQVRARLEEPRGCRDIQRFLAPWLA
jgi:thioredoxin-like negative regulator of GroEL